MPVIMNYAKVLDLSVRKQDYITYVRLFGALLSVNIVPHSRYWCFKSITPPVIVNYLYEM